MSGKYDYSITDLNVLCYKDARDVAEFGQWSQWHPIEGSNKEIVRPGTVVVPVDPIVFYTEASKRKIWVDPGEPFMILSPSMELYNPDNNRHRIILRVLYGETASWFLLDNGHAGNINVPPWLPASQQPVQFWAISLLQLFKRLTK